MLKNTLELLFSTGGIVYFSIGVVLCCVAIFAMWSIIPESVCECLFEWDWQCYIFFIPLVLSVIITFASLWLPIVIGLCISYVFECRESRLKRLSTD